MTTDRPADGRIPTPRRRAPRGRKATSHRPVWALTLRAGQPPGICASGRSLRTLPNWSYDAGAVDRVRTGQRNRARTISDAEVDMAKSGRTGRAGARSIVGVEGTLGLPSDAG